MKIKKIPSFYFILWIIVILTVSSIPHLKAPGPQKINIDKLYHFAEYFILNTLFLKSAFFNFRQKKVNLIVIFIMIFPIIDELHQNFIPGRQCSVYDIIADIFGLFTSFLILKLLKK